MKKHFVDFWENITSLDKAKQRAEKIIQIIEKYHNQAIKLLELGVGIGVVLKNFPEKYFISGLDIEKEYIEYCKRNFPRAKFYHSSMHDFNLKEKYEVIFSVYDSINFLSNFEQWTATFLCVEKHLSEKGLFIFDMYTEKILSDEKILQHTCQVESIGYSIDRGIVNNNLLEWEVIIFEHKKENQYEKHIFSFYERIFPTSKVENELSKYFDIIEKELYEEDKKIRFICRKKGTV